MNLQLDYLAARPTALSIIAHWYFDQWRGLMSPDDTVDAVAARLQEYLNTDRIPLIVTGHVDDELVGAVQLKFREMSIFPEKEHWLGGVYVAERWRRRGIAEAIIREAIGIARRLGVTILHLQTLDHTGGLYARIGWRPLDVVNYRGADVLVMVLDVNA